VIVALSLLTSAATAYAECAWVLWTTRTGERYIVDSGHPTLPECEAAVASWVALFERDGYEVRWAGKGSRELFVKRSGSDWRYFCLPDTVDPRGPRGK